MTPRIHASVAATHSSLRDTVNIQTQRPVSQERLHTPLPKGRGLMIQSSRCLPHLPWRRLRSRKHIIPHTARRRDKLVLLQLEIERECRGLMHSSCCPAFELASAILRSQLQRSANKYTLSSRARNSLISFILSYEYRSGRKTRKSLAIHLSIHFLARPALLLIAGVHDLFQTWNR